jgi:hypothetical protein
MVDNFVARLFPQIEGEKHNTSIDEIDLAGIASTVNGCVTYPGTNEYDGKAINSGLKTFAYESQRFSVVGKLDDFGLGFF